MGGRGASGRYAGVVVIRGGKKYTYYLRNGKLQNAETLGFMSGNGDSQLKKLIENGGRPLTSSQVRNLNRNRAEDRKNIPDYEMGNPFGERGKSKTIYRPRRRKW